MERLKHLLFVFAIWIATAESLEFEVEPPISHAVLRVGDMKSLTCRSKLNTDYRIEWKVPQGISGNDYRIKEEITSTGEKQTMKYDVSELIIPDYQDRMAGKYKCQLINKSTSKVENEYAVDFHTITRESDEDVMFYPENKTLTLTCKIAVKDAVIGEPVWKKGDTLISDVLTDGSELEPKGENLTIKGVMRSDCDLYTAEYTIDIKGERVIYKCEVPLKAGPLVLKFEKSKNLIQEDNLELQCKVLGYPKPVVMWYKDTELILDDGNGRVVKQDLNGVKNASLTIKNVDYDDAGEYKCLAITEELKQNSSQVITVRVKDKFAALWPFLGIVGEVVVLCAIIFIYEKRRSRLAEQEEAAQDEPEPTKKGNVRNRRHQK